MNLLWISYGTTYLPKVHFWLTKEVYWRNWPKHSSLSNKNAKKEIPWSCGKMPFISLFFKAFLCLIVSVLQPIEIRVFINQQHMHFVGTKKRLFNPLVQLKELPLLSRNKRAHNHCLWTSLLNWRRTHSDYQSSLSQVQFRSRTNNLYNIGRLRDIQKTRFPVLS